MRRFSPRARDELPEFEPFWRTMESALGFVPNSLLIMAYKPDLLGAFSKLAQTVLNPEESHIPLELKHLLGHVASASAGCLYCQAHTAKNAATHGTPERLEQVWEFETSPLFDEAERAALRLARDAALVPNAVTDDHFAALSRHYDPAAVVELMGVVSLFGWLNRWNDSFATELEDAPARFASARLGVQGWTPGKHESSSVREQESH